MRRVHLYKQLLNSTCKKFCMEVKHFWAWYKKLRKQGYGIFTSFSSALYNCKHYDIEGNYK